MAEPPYPRLDMAGSAVNIVADDVETAAGSILGICSGPEARLCG